jgi:hypothetical protein
MGHRILVQQSRVVGRTLPLQTIQEPWQFPIHITAYHYLHMQIWQGKTLWRKYRVMILLDGYQTMRICLVKLTCLWNQGCHRSTDMLYPGRRPRVRRFSSCLSYASKKGNRFWWKDRTYQVSAVLVSKSLYFCCFPSKNCNSFAAVWNQCSCLVVWFLQIIIHAVHIFKNKDNNKKNIGHFGSFWPWWLLLSRNINHHYISIIVQQAKTDACTQITIRYMKSGQMWQHIPWHQSGTSTSAPYITPHSWQVDIFYMVKDQHLWINWDKKTRKLNGVSTCSVELKLLTFA